MGTWPVVESSGIAAMLKVSDAIGMPLPELTKTVAVILPVLVSALAFTYDVGFFSGLNIEFFTFFSIAEHLVFALQALPFAIGPAIWIVILYASVIVGDKYSDVSVERKASQLRQMAPVAQEQRLTGLRAQMLFFKVADPLVQMSLIGFAVWLFQQKAYIGAMTVVVSTALNYTFWRRKQRTEWFVLFAIVSACLPFLVAFTVGFDFAQRLQRTDTPSFIATVGLQDIPGIVVRAGERGVLFYSIKQKKVLLIRWDSIKRLEGAVLQM